MTPRAVIRPAADRDLDEQAEYYLSRSPDTAVRWYQATEEAIEFLARNPGIGTIRETRKSILRGIRTWPISGFERHIIFYRPIDAGVDILRVIHGSRDIDRILEASGEG
jgi:toxin ParE1/3/4